ncbi:hypothetical protein ACFL3Q_00205 [Planctomycetota bacterium]
MHRHTKPSLRPRITSQRPSSGTNLTPTLTTIARTPYQPLITNRTPSSKADCLASGILGTDQQN